MSWSGIYWIGMERHNLVELIQKIHKVIISSFFLKKVLLWTTWVVLILADQVKKSVSWYVNITTAIASQLLKLDQSISSMRHDIKSSHCQSWKIKFMMSWSEINRIGMDWFNMVGSFNVNSMDFTSCEHVKISDQVFAVPILECHNHDVMIRELLIWYELIQFGWINPCQFNIFHIILARQDRKSSTCDFNS